ncbi:hypothetical protein TRVA0_050S01002 [Trichomonascus vanleenenianus]|uniref:uncharacterized protein n=1 Tax=Trichomonascus vanleenenianus TaxID=2268995 RepID=UPI003ECA538E
MWVLWSAVSPSRRFLCPGKSYVVGRGTEADIRLNISAEISRAHFRISIGPPHGRFVAQKSNAVLEALSKTGVAVYDDRNRAEAKIGRNQSTELYAKNREKIRLVLTPASTNPIEVYLEWVDVVFTLSTGMDSIEELDRLTNEIREVVEPMDIKLINEIHPLTTHLIQGKLKSVKSLSALVRAIPIVTKDYVDEVAKKVDGKYVLEDCFEMPDPLQFVPEKTLLPDAKRKNLYEGITLVFGSASLRARLLDPVTAAGGKIVMLDTTKHSTAESAVEFLNKKNRRASMDSWVIINPGNSDSNGGEIMRGVAKKLDIAIREPQAIADVIVYADIRYLLGEPLTATRRQSSVMSFFGNSSLQSSAAGDGSGKSKTKTTSSSQTQSRNAPKLVDPFDLIVKPSQVSQPSETESEGNRSKRARRAPTPVDPFEALSRPRPVDPFEELSKRKRSGSPEEAHKKTRIETPAAPAEPKKHIVRAALDPDTVAQTVAGFEDDNSPPELTNSPGARQAEEPEEIDFSNLSVDDYNDVVVVDDTMPVRRAGSYQQSINRDYSGRPNFKGFKKSAVPKASRKVDLVLEESETLTEKMFSVTKPRQKRKEQLQNADDSDSSEDLFVSENMEDFLDEEDDPREPTPNPQRRPTSPPMRFDERIDSDEEDNFRFTT